MSLASIAYLIQSIPPTPAGEHVHLCPRCYAYAGCAVCAFCEAEASA